MSYVRKKNIYEKIKSIRTFKSFAREFLLDTVAGQKLFLHNCKLPRVINVSLNEHTCMFKCVMCPYTEEAIRKFYQKKQEMSFETFKNIVASIPNDSFYSLDISSIGETLEFKDLPKFIEYAKKNKPLLNVIISTNGVLLDKEMAKQLIASGLDNIQISLMSGNERYHEIITGTKAYSKVKNNIVELWKLKQLLKANKPFVQVFMLEAIETKQYEQQFLDEFSQYSDKAFIRPLYNVGRKISGLTTLKEYEVPKYRYPCVMPWYSTAIRSNGDVLGCYMFHWHPEMSKTMVVGNINKQTLEEIWAGELMQKFRLQHIYRCSNLDNPVCSRCNSWAAYTNIWTEIKDKKGVVSYQVKVQCKDFFKKSDRGRGG